ncbi:SusC/RagA family TonB-linked outer membrane protein [Paludibacter sp.]|uniref:SusC/RagA family TonB-linked outer membrane protein n=1 Tax=Paludibacter sp. TaxID=1898105 RepID=UPI0013537406|nr:SusC/RagA family TonB-linked outer membrane protein [Paludibacter sp.]MTK54626.1 SusC/RagA family TonB-linked outer membrane protein [Paludibacter sp.]
MKRLLILAVICYSTVVFAQVKKVTITLQNATVKTALEVLQKQTDLSLWFNTRDVDLNKSVSVKLQSKSIDEALDAILAGQQVCYELKSDHIVITRKTNFSLSQQNQTTTVDRKVNGTVTDENGQPMQNVVVRERRSRVGTITDENGRFSLNIPADTKTLQFSCLGMLPLELPAYNGMKVQMQQDDREMGEVVVTALDIKRDKKSLPYSSQSIDADEISKGRDMNLASSLSGTVSGINLLQSESGAGGSTKITLRGPKNITSTNQPLFVIDGVPVSNYQTSDPYGFYSGRDSGDGLSNINPDEIESMTILKGANAAALYGSQGSNGVILITTKKGIAGNTKITLNSGVKFTSVSEYPQLQYEYGQTSLGADDSWGAKGNYKNIIKDFFNTGTTIQNSIALSGGNDRMTTYFSYGNAFSSGVMPTNSYAKNNVSFRQTSAFLENRLSVSSNVMLTTESLHNTILNGYYWNPLLGLYNFPRGLDFTYYKNNYQKLNTTRNIMAQNWPITGNAEGEMNPYWILNNDPDDTKTKRIIGNVTLKYNLMKGVTISARGNYDYTNQLYEMKAKATSSPVLVSDNGRYIYSNLDSWQAYGDVLLTFDNPISKNIDLHAVLGAAYQKKVVGDGLYIDSNVYGLTIVNNFTIQNIASLLAFNNSQTISSRIAKESVFGNISLGYKGLLYLDLSGRNDWASSLAFTGHLAYFYPSVGVSLIMSQMLRLPKFVSFAKLRASFAEVSNEIPSFMTNVTGSVSSNGYTGSFVKSFTELKPEMSDNYEAGLELRLFSNRLGIDFTCYQIENRDQYLQLQAPSGSGYTAYYVNAGNVRTKGVEIAMTATPVSNKTFIWNSIVNFSSNHNKITTLGNQLTGYYTIPGGGEGYDMKVVTGGSMGDLYTFAYVRDAKGNIVLDDRHVPVKTTIEKKVGNANPAWMLGWNNKFAYKNIQFSFIVDGKFGGKYISMTQAYLDRNGVTKVTADARNAGGVYVSGVMTDGTPWSGMVDAKEYYTGTAGRGGIMEQYVYDATNVRLRQAALGYTFSFNKAKNRWFKDLTLSLITSNLFFFYKKAPGNPNMTISTGNGTQAVENFGLPPVRSYAFNLKLNM